MAKVDMGLLGKVQQQKRLENHGIHCMQVVAVVVEMHRIITLIEDMVDQAVVETDQMLWGHLVLRELGQQVEVEAEASHILRIMQDLVMQVDLEFVL